jgi:hypothetical protein
VEDARGLGTPAQAAATAQPQLPLCERQAQHAVPLRDLLAWLETALLQVKDVGDSWAQQDDGPSAEDLRVRAASLQRGQHAMQCKPESTASVAGLLHACKSDT